MKNVVIVAPHFPPSNLAGVHRARLLSQYLSEFGWNPIILTTDWRHYEEALDWDLHALVDPQLEVIATPAFPTRPFRLVGDIGVRAMHWHIKALKDLRRQGRMDFLLVTIPSFFSGILGALLYRHEPLPFGIDYIDPWVYSLPATVRHGSKEWASMQLNQRLEPFAVRHAGLISGVAEGYFAGVVERNPHLRGQAVFAAAPYGFSEKDFLAPAVGSKPPFLFDSRDGKTHLVYAGALLPQAHVVLQSLLAGVGRLAETSPELASRLRLHFIGTGRSPSDPNGSQVLPDAQERNGAQYVSEHPHRMGYLDVLSHLKHAGGAVIVGSTEPHYTPSKVYQAVQARRPILALLHEASSAVDVLRRSRAGHAITLSEHRLPTPSEVADGLAHLITSRFDPEAVDWTVFDGFSARQSARVIATAMDEAHKRFPRSLVEPFQKTSL